MEKIVPREVAIKLIYSGMYFAAEKNADHGNITILVAAQMVGDGRGCPLVTK